MSMFAENHKGQIAQGGSLAFIIYLIRGCSMKSGFILIGVLLCMFLVPFSGQNEAEAEIVYLAGDEDEFAAPSDLASPSAELSTAFGYLWPGGGTRF